MRNARRLVSLTAIVFLGAALLYLLGRAPLAGYLATRLGEAAAAHDIRVSLKEPTLGGVSFAAESADLFFQRSLTTLLLEQVVLTPSLRAIVGGNPGGTISASAYGGALALTVTQPPDSLLIDGSLTDVNLNLHPQLAGFGVTAGRLTLRAQSLLFPLGGGAPSSGNFSLDIQGLEKPKPSLLPGNTVIPSVANLSMSLAGNASPERITIKQLTVTSPLGTLDGEGHVELSVRGLLLAFRLMTEVSLTLEGQTLFGPFLPSISEGRIQQSDARFSISLIGNRGDVEIRFDRPA